MSDFFLIQNKLIGEEGMDLVHAAIMTADMFNYYSEDIMGAIVNWANGKNVHNFEVNGTKVADIMEELSCSEFKALGILNAVKCNQESFEDAVLMLGEDTML